jgi:hypothetical protein
MAMAFAAASWLAHTAPIHLCTLCHTLASIRQHGPGVTYFRTHCIQHRQSRACSADPACSRAGQVWLTETLWRMEHDAAAQRRANGDDLY